MQGNVSRVALAILMIGCTGGRGGPGSGFDSGLLSPTRALGELELSEQTFFCNEGRTYINGLFPLARWEEGCCIGYGLSEPTPEACEARVDACLTDSTCAGVDYTYSPRCSFRSRLACTLTIEELEGCMNELAAEYLRFDAEYRTCSIAGTSTPPFEPELSAGCEVAYNDTDCGCALGRASGDGTSCP